MLSSNGATSYTVNCVASSSSTGGTSGHSHSPHSHTPHAHVPIDKNPSSLGVATGVAAACAHLDSVLETFPGCKCTDTNAGAGLVASCQESIQLGGGLNWDIGIKAEVEPCVSSPYVAVSYKFGGDWTELDKVQANADDLLVDIPGTTIAGNGLYLKVQVKGNAQNMEVHLMISVRLLGKELHEANLIEFTGIDFSDICPNNTMIPIYAAAAGAVVLLLVVAVIINCIRKKRRAANMNYATRAPPPQQGGVVMTQQVVASGEESKI